MLSGSRSDSGTQNLPAGVRKTIQSIKEIVGNHSYADIYLMLKETNMDPNETTQKLLTQDPFHEVKRKRDKRKQSTSYYGSTESRIRPDTGQGGKSQTFRDRNAWRGSYPRGTLPGFYINIEEEARKRIDQKQYDHEASSGVTQEFRVVRDNRVNQNTDRETKSTSHQSPASKDQVLSNVPEQSSPGIPTDEKHSHARNSGPHISRQHFNVTRDSGLRNARDSDSNSTGRQHLSEAPSSTLRGHGQGTLNSQPHSPSAASSNSISVGVYFSSSDPVHVPSPDSRSNGTVGAIKRAVGIVGVRRQSSEQSAARSSVASSSFSISPLGKEISTSATSFAAALPVTNQFSQPSIHEPVMLGNSVSRPPAGNQFNSKQHQQISGHQKASVLNMEWKPKSASQKPNLSSPGVIGTSMVPISSPASNSASPQEDMAHLPEKVSQMNISENQHVIIPHHLRVPEADRTRLIFGSFGPAFDSLQSFMPGFEVFGEAEESKIEPSASNSIPVEVAPGDLSGDQVDALEGQAGISGSDSPASVTASENPLQDDGSSTPQNLQNYANTGLVRNDSPSYGSAEPQQQQDPSHLPSLPDYDPQTGYEAPFFRPVMEENMRGHGLTSTLEGLNSHAPNSIPPSTMAMVQQQPVTQLYQQPGVHISHFPNYLQYRQFLSPLYVHPMAVPNFSGNPAYPYPSGGNSYVLMPGGSSHLSASGLKYAPAQYKPLAATGYGNYTSPAGYAVSTPVTVGAATGLEDVSRIKYKDGNLFFPNRQTEGSEIWMQTPREIPAMHSNPYYNVSGQAPHTAYVSSPMGHTSFNAAQSPHVPFTGLYHPPPQAAMANPHHLVHHQQMPGMSGNVGVGVATAGAGAQVGPYQQPQLGHLSWTNNF